MKNDEDHKSNEYNNNDNKDKDNDVLIDLKKTFKDIANYGKGICCVCHHELGLHIDEKDVWRCHSLGADGFQCECALRKNRAENISYYDLSKRAIQQLEDFDKDFLLEGN